MMHAGILLLQLFVGMYYSVYTTPDHEREKQKGVFLEGFTSRTAGLCCILLLV